MKHIILAAHSKIKVNDQFGHAVVIGPVFRVRGTKNNQFTQPYSVCVCRCKCGTTYVALARHLDQASNCGCLTSSKIGDAKLKRPRLKPGDVFGKLTVLGTEFRLSDISRSGVMRRWKSVVCKCECGMVLVVRVSNLVHTGQENCQCDRRLATIAMLKARAVHGESGTNLHRRWSRMISRCYSKSNIGYGYYGGRGISVCDEWKFDYRTFRDWAIRNGWNPSLQIDRINNEGNYEPSNCRFVTSKENNRNKRNNTRITAWGETKSLIEWTEDPRCSIADDCLWKRLYKHHWSPEEAISLPKRNTGPHSRRSGCPR